MMRQIQRCGQGTPCPYMQVKYYSLSFNNSSLTSYLSPLKSLLPLI